MGNTNTLPVVSQVKSGVQLLTAGIHLLAGDAEGAEQAFLSANRSTCVVAGGVGGFLVGGPVGAVAGGVGGGAIMDSSATALSSYAAGEFTPAGSIAAVTNAVRNPSGGAIFDAVLVPVLDT